VKSGILVDTLEVINFKHPAQGRGSQMNKIFSGRFDPGNLLTAQQRNLAQ